MNRLALCAFAALLLAFGTARADPYDDAIAAYKRGEVANSIVAFRSLAEQGHPKAQYTIATMYDIGDGVPQSDAEALKWYRLAAGQGVPEAQNTLGVVAQGDERYPEAMKWFRLAAVQGDAEGQYNLGGMYYIGLGVRANPAEATKWTRMAAEQGYAQAQYRVGAMYANGQGVATDLIESVKWWRLSVAQGYAAAQTYLGQMYYLGQGGVPQDFAEAAKLYRLSAIQGNAEAQSVLADMYSQGQGVTKDLVRAHMWYEVRATSDYGYPEDAVASRSELEKRMTAAQIAESRKLAAGCKKRDSKDCD